MKKSVFSMCGMCTVRCPIRVEVEDEVVKWIEGNPHDPGMAGRLCAKGSAGLAMEYDYERPSHPMIREGKRGEGKWRKATWDEALDLIGDKIGGCPRMAIFRNLCVRLRFESSKYFNVFLRLKSSPSLTLQRISHSRTSS